MLFVVFGGSHCHFWCLFAELLPLCQGCLSRAAWPSQAGQTSKIPSWRYLRMAETAPGLRSVAENPPATTPRSTCDETL